MSLKISKYIIGIRNGNLPDCSAVPQPTASPGDQLSGVITQEQMCMEHIVTGRFVIEYVLSE